MELFFEGQVLWSQIDANQHLRHSAYADFGAQARINMLSSVGLTYSRLAEAKIGPVIFSEELRYLREVRLGDFIKVNCELINARLDGSRWSIRHELIRSDGIVAAIIICEGSWIDTEKRKLAWLTPEMREMFLKTPKSTDFGKVPLSPKSQ
jgi:acyl-CoA thioester hydrolase